MGTSLGRVLPLAPSLIVWPESNARYIRAPEGLPIAPALASRAAAR